MCAGSNGARRNAQSLHCSDAHAAYRPDSGPSGVCSSSVVRYILQACRKHIFHLHAARGSRAVIGEGKGKDYCLILLDRIVIDPAICMGKPTIRGTRITVDFVLRLIGDGLAPQDIVRDHPELTLEDVQQAAKYAAWLASEQTAPIA